MAVPVGSGSCGFDSDSPSWQDQLEAHSPCYEVNLLDGLNEESSDEVFALFDCMNYHGHLESLVPASVTLNDPTRTGRSAAIEMARGANQMSSLGLNPMGIIPIGHRLLTDESNPLEHAQDIALELTYGQNATRVRTAGFDLNSPETLETSLLVPLQTVLPAAASALIDTGPEPTDWIAQQLTDSEIARLIRTLNSATLSSNPTIQEPLDALGPNLGEAILRTRSASNDRWIMPGSDSLRGLMTKASTHPFLTEIAEEIEPLLNDIVVRERIEDVLVEHAESGNLTATAARLQWMTQVDRRGESLTNGEDSALYGFSRLIYQGNRSIECEVDLWVGTIRVDLGNLAVALLDSLADMDPDTIQTGVDILGDIIGWPLSQFLLEQMADTGLCPGIDSQMVNDLVTLDLLAYPDNRPLLETAIDLLQAAKYGQGDQSRIPEVVNLLSAVHRHQVIEPLEEVLRDTGDADLIANVVDIIPILSQPTAHGLDGGTQTPADLQAIFTILHSLFQIQGSEAPWEWLHPTMSTVLNDKNTWTSVGHLGSLLTDPDSRTSQPLQLLPPLIEADPELELLNDISLVFASHETVTALLVVLENEAMWAELLSPTPSAPSAESPLAFCGRLIVRGAIDDLFSLLRTLLTALED